MDLLQQLHALDLQVALHRGEEADAHIGGDVLMLQLGVADGEVFLFGLPQELAESQTGLQLCVNGQDLGIAAHMVFPCVQQGERQIDGNSTHQSNFIKTDAYGKADTGGGPQTCGGGQTFDLVALGDDDGARAEEADAADDLRTHTDRVAGAGGLKNVLIGQHDHTGAEAHQHIGAEASRAVFEPSFHADDTGKYDGDQNADDDLKHRQITKFQHGKTPSL